MAHTLSKRNAQMQVDGIRAFRRQVEELKQAGVVDLSPEQSVRLDAYLDGTLAKLAERYDVDISDSQKQISLGMRILSALGGLAFCVALVLFFYHFWGTLRTPVQVTVLVAAPILGLAATDFASRREKTSYYATLISLVALAAFVLNLGVLASVFNMASSPGAFLAWGIFALILAYVYRLRLALFVGLAALVVYPAATLAAWQGAQWEMFILRPESLMAGGVILLAIPLLVPHRRCDDFPEVYRWTGLVLLFTAVEFLAHGGELSFLPGPVSVVESGYRVFGFLAAGITVAVGIRRHFLGIVNLGSGVFALYLFDQLFSWWWDWMPKYLLFLIIGCLALLLLTAFRKMRSRLQEKNS